MIHIYIYMYSTYIHRYIHTYIYIYVYMYVCMCVCMCVCMFIYIYIYIFFFDLFVCRYPPIFVSVVIGWLWPFSLQAAPGIWRSAVWPMRFSSSAGETTDYSVMICSYNKNA